jgi:hypothetical protein
MCNNAIKALLHMQAVIHESIYDYLYNGAEKVNICVSGFVRPGNNASGDLIVKSKEISLKTKVLFI